MTWLLNRILCLLSGHHWEAPERQDEWFYSYEDVGKGGGLYYEIVQGDGTEPDAWLNTYFTRTCARCGKSKHVE